ncbi:MAG: FAD binding domain-containing protein [Desulfobacteraceae bacterium]
MRLPRFEYAEPKSIKEACAILNKDPAAKVLAGGTDLLVNMKHRVELPSVVVNIKRVSGLDFIAQDNGTLKIGALTPLKKIYSTPLVREKVPALAQAASSVGSYHHQSMGTLGGNLCQQNRCMYFNQSQWWRSARPTCYKAGGEICHVVNKREICYSSYCGDVAPALMVLNAQVILESKGKARELPLERFFSGDGKTPLVLKKGEILTEVTIPEEAMKGFSTYIKFSNRESIDFPIVGHAFWASTEEKAYRASFTAVDRRPLRAKNIEGVLKGKDLNEEVVEEASGLAAEEAKPVKNSVYSPSYKRRMMGVLLRCSMNDAIGSSR